MSPPTRSKASASDGGSTRRRHPHPPVDERLVAPESRYEILDGKVEYVPPADEPHGIQHSKISALLQAYAADGYAVAVDMLTRTSETGDMAPDASVYPAARDEQTGGRRLEELAFEVLSTERLGHAAKKARALLGRGVRRVFAVDVERRRALARSTATDNWEILPADGALADPALGVPLPIAALVDAGRADDAVAAALIARKNPTIDAAIRAGERRGALTGKREALIAVLHGRGFKPDDAVKQRIRDTEDEAQLDDWLGRAVREASLADILGR